MRVYVRMYHTKTHAAKVAFKPMFVGSRPTRDEISDADSLCALTTVSAPHGISHTHTHPHTHTRAHTYTPTHTPPTHTHTHARTHTHTHTHTPHTHTLTLLTLSDNGTRVTWLDYSQFAGMTLDARNSRA